MIKHHTNRAFDNELRLLRDRLLLLAGRVEKMAALSIKALSEHDTALAHATMDYYKTIDGSDLLIDRLSIELLARRQPCGQDLRFIVSVIKMVVCFERLGDLANKICKRVIDLKRINSNYDSGDLASMALHVQAMVKEVLDAFVYKDCHRASSVITQDVALDEIYRIITRNFINEMSQRKEDAENYYHLLSIAKWLERMGDHCTNLAEIILYMINGDDVRTKHDNGHLQQ